MSLLDAKVTHTNTVATWLVDLTRSLQGLNQMAVDEDVGDMLDTIEGMCRHCGTRKNSCYIHCHERDDGVHVPDPAAMVPANESGRNRGVDWVVDVYCAECGVSGATRIDPETISWE